MIMKHILFIGMAGNVLQLYLVAEFENKNFKQKQNYVRKQKLE